MALISKASLLMVPSTYEPGTLFNVLPSGNRAPDSTNQNSGYDQTRADFDFDRGSNTAATRVNSDGLIEKYRENELLQSNNFSNAAWQKVNATLTTGQSDPFGGNNATKVDFGAGGNNYIFQGFLGSTNVRTRSIWMRADSNIEVGFSDGVTANVINVTTSWVRYEAFLATIPASGLQIDNYFGVTTPQQALSVYIYGAQVEDGLVATDYLESTSVTGKAGVLVDLPRINYDANGENGALLLEPSRQQLIQYSEWFGASNWNKTRATISDNVSVSPEGVQNAAKIISTAVDNSHYIRHDVSSTTGVCYVFAKADDFTFLKLATNAHSFSPSFFNLTNGEVTKSALYDAEIETYGNGWYKCIIKPTDAFTQFFIENAGDSASATHLGDGVKGVFIYGAQVEPNATYASSYIPNHGESGGVTRAADSCSVTGVSDVIGQTEGTMYWEGIVQPNDNPILVQLIPSAAGNYTNTIYLEYVHSSTEFKVQAWDTGVKQVQINTGAITAGQVYKLAFAYKANDFALYMNGTQIGTDTSGSVQSGLDKIGLGSLNGTTNAAFYGSEAKQAALFKERLSNAELATLTTL